MNAQPESNFKPLCDLHHSPMRSVTLDRPSPVQTQSAYQCERRDCNRIFRDGFGYSDFGEGEYDASRESSRECPTCGGTLFLARVDQSRKVETWECAVTECNYTEDVRSPSGR